MSNATVGNVYDHIIQEVINAVRVDFEENGVDDGILEELKKVRLSPSPDSPPRIIRLALALHQIHLQNSFMSLFLLPTFKIEGLQIADVRC